MGAPGAFFEVFPVSAVLCFCWTAGKGDAEFHKLLPECRIVLSLDTTVEPSGRALVQYDIASPSHPGRRSGDLISGLQALTASRSGLLQLHLLHHHSLFPLHLSWHSRCVAMAADRSPAFADPLLPRCRCLLIG